MTERWALTVEYDGTPFCGWQRQICDTPSVQQLVEEAILSFSQQEVRLHVAGRTDSGVHALGQIAHFDFDYKKQLSGYEMAKAINAYLRPHPISVVHAEVVSEDFHARFGAKNKLYIYRIVTRPAPLGVESGKAWHLRKKLDYNAMQDAAPVLLGEHDFSSFRAAECQANSPIRDISRLNVEYSDYDRFGGQDIRIHVEGRAFLHHMVRNIAGSLVYVGQGKWSKADLKAALDAKDRAAGGPTAPAEGLYLARIDYL